MKRVDVRDMTVEWLVARFAAIALEQYDALMVDEIARFNRLYDQMELVEEELRARGDQRRALLALYDESNMQVRLAAAKATLAVAPKEAREMLEQIAGSHEHPQAGDAGMTLVNLDRGIFKPT